MQYRKIGKWGIQVSEIALGSWLTYGGSVEERNSIEQIHFAFEKGINFFDTSNAYYRGAAETVVGKAIKDLNRDSIVLATKVFFPMGEGPNDRGLSRKHVVEQCNASLKRLQVDYIDLYQCHRFDPNTPMEELVRTMDDLTRQGKILYWGVSEWSAAQITDAVNTARLMNAVPPISNQPGYNMLNRNIEREIVPVSAREGMGQVVFSPLAQGVLTGKYKPGQAPPGDSRAADEKSNMFIGGYLKEETLNKVEQIVGIAEALKLSPAQLALAWCLRLPEVSSVIIGATKTSQIEDNIQASGVKLAPEITEHIDQILAS